MLCSGKKWEDKWQVESRDDTARFGSEVAPRLPVHGWKTQLGASAEGAPLPPMKGGTGQPCSSWVRRSRILSRGIHLQSLLFMARLPRSRQSSSIKQPLDNRDGPGTVLIIQSAGGSFYSSVLPKSSRLCISYQGTGTNIRRHPSSRNSRSCYCTPPSNQLPA